MCNAIRWAMRWQSLDQVFNGFPSLDGAFAGDGGAAELLAMVPSVVGDFAWLMLLKCVVE